MITSTNAHGVVPELPRGAPATCPFAPPDALLSLQQTRPLVRVVLPDGVRTWLASDLATVREVLAHPDFGANPKTAGYPRWNLPGGTDLPLSMTHADPPVHTQMRQMISGEFTLKRIRELRPELERITRACCDAIDLLPGPVDLVTQFSTRIPSLAISLLLGVRESDLTFFERNARLVLAHEHLESAERDEAKAAMLKYVTALIVDKRHNPDDRLLSKVIEENPHVSDLELVSFVALLLFAGFSTTAHMIELMVVTLTQRPDLAAQVRRDHDVIPALVDELLRYHSIVRDSPRRVALADVTIGDTVIRRGEGVIASIQAANWDATAFPRPQDIDLDRPRSPKHLAFGYGIHTCVGSTLARAELEIVLREVVTRYPDMTLAVADSEVPYRTTTHLHGCYSLPVWLQRRSRA